MLTVTVSLKVTVFFGEEVEGGRVEKRLREDEVVSVTSVATLA